MITEKEVRYMTYHTLSTGTHSCWFPDVNYSHCIRIALRQTAARSWLSVCDCVLQIRDVTRGSRPGGTRTHEASVWKGVTLVVTIENCLTRTLCVHSVPRIDTDACWCEILKVWTYICNVIFGWIYFWFMWIFGCNKRRAVKLSRDGNDFHRILRYQEL